MADEYIDPGDSSYAPPLPADRAPLRITVGGPQPESTEPKWSDFGQVTTQKEGAPSWDSFGTVKTQAGAVEDVLKSTGAGLTKGAIGVVGIPGDIAEAAEAGAEWAGLTPGTIPKTPIEKRIPSSRSIRQTVEGWTGPLHEPQTPVGRVFGETAELVPGTVMFGTGAAGLGRKAAEAGKDIAKFAVGGQAGGEAAAAVAPEDYKGAAKTGGTIVAGGAAGVLMTPQKAHTMLRNALPEYVTPQVVRQAGDLIRDAERMGVRLTWPEALSQTTGRDVLLDTQRFLESSKRTQATMKGAIGERADAVDQAARRQIETVGPRAADADVIGPQVGRAAEEQLDEARQIINRHAEPFYQATEAVRLTPQEFAAARRVPGWAAARDAIRADPQLNRYVAHLGDDTIGFLNEVKKRLGQQSEHATQPLGTEGRNMQRAAGFSADERAIRQIALDASLRAGGGTINAYDMALTIERDARRRILEPLEQGPLGKLARSDLPTQRAIEALFPDTIVSDPDKVRTAVTALVTRNPPAAQALVRAHLELELEKAIIRRGVTPEAAEYTGAQFAHGAVGSPVLETRRLENLRAAVEALPQGQQIWAGLDRMFEVMQATGMRQRPGSKTAFNQELQESMGVGGAGSETAKVALSPGVWLKKANEVIGKWQAGQNLDELARIITDPNAGAILARLSALPKHSPEAAFLVARLTALSQSARRPTEPAKSEK